MFSARDRRALLAVVAIVTVTPLVSVSGLAAASGSPQAALSINPASPALTVEFVAQAQNFPVPVTSYHWIFGDGQSATTSTATVTHTYGSASVFTPSVTETDSRHDTATATAILSLNECPAGVTQCTETLGNTGNVQLLHGDRPRQREWPGGSQLAGRHVQLPRLPVCDRVGRGRHR